jgi:archaeal flagellar protein FlaI
MRTGHSVYATLHANSVDEAMIRLTTPPIDIPKTVLNSLSLLIVQNRNRRTGVRRTFQVAEALETGDFNILYELDVSKDEIKEVSQPKRLYKTLKLFSGLNEVQIKNDMKEKIKLLKYLVDKNIDDVHEIGSIVSDYYSNSEYVFKRLFPKEQQQK